MNRIEASKKVMDRLDISENELSASFPEFKNIKNHFLYGEVWPQGSLNESLRALITVVVLTTLDGYGLEEQLHAALYIGLKPDELQEVFHQAAPYIGFAKAEKGLSVLKKVFDTEKIILPLKGNATVTEDNRLEKGIAAQKSIFGQTIDKMRANAPEDQKVMQDYLSAYCFGDTYTRSGLDLRTRELITLVCISTLGGCESQVRAHVGGNLAVGNSKEVLLSAIYQCLPYIGFPRALNAIAAINEVAK